MSLVAKAGARSKQQAGRQAKKQAEQQARQSAKKQARRRKERGKRRKKSLRLKASRRPPVLAAGALVWRLKNDSCKCW